MSTMIVYVGKNTGGHFLPDGRFAGSGDPVEVSDDLAVELLARNIDAAPQWVAATKKKPTTAAVAAEES